MPRLLVPLATLALALPGPAQSLNVDLTVFPSTTRPVPSYAGAAAQTGAWCNGYHAGSSHTLTSIHQESTDGAYLLVVGGSGGLVVDQPATSGNDGELLDDGLALDAATPLATLRFGPMHAGDYAVTTYAWDPRSASNLTRVAVQGAVEPAQDVGGVWTGAHALGTTYALHHVSLPAGGMLEISTTALGADGFVSGFQVVWSHRDDGLCHGDGVQAVCPCANSSSSLLRRGCNQSAGNSLHLYAAGTTSPDALKLYTHGAFDMNFLSTSTVVLAQGDALVAQGPFGDGARCLGGNLLRLYVRSSSGSVSPQTSEPSVSARSAALGDPLTPGSTRWYFAYYRDPSPAFCPPPAGSTFNASNAWRVVW